MEDASSAVEVGSAPDGCAPMKGSRLGALRSRIGYSGGLVPMSSPAADNAVGGFRRVRSPLVILDYVRIK